MRTLESTNDFVTLPCNLQLNKRQAKLRRQLQTGEFCPESVICCYSSMQSWSRFWQWRYVSFNFTLKTEVTSLVTSVVFIL